MQSVKGVYLRCCHCNSGLRGRQWWNRDEGFGLCDDCISFVGLSDFPIGATTQSYGVRGLHWDINNPLIPKRRNKNVAEASLQQDCSIAQEDESELGSGQD